MFDEKVSPAVRLHASLAEVRASVHRKRYVLLSLLSLLLGIVAWELYTMTQPEYLFPRIASIADAFVVQVNDYDLAYRTGQSLTSLLVGFVIAAIVGIPIGLAMGLNRDLDVMLNRYVDALYVSPISALVPVIILVGGASFESRVFIIFLFCVLEIIIDTYEGVASTPQELIDVSKSFGMGPYETIRKVVIPHDLPYIFAGLRLGVGKGVRGMILAELLIDFRNLGAVIRTFQDGFQIAGVLSIVVLLMVVGLLLTALVKLIRDQVVTWD